jgi:hypothetical protein
VRRSGAGPISGARVCEFHNYDPDGCRRGTGRSPHTPISGQIEPRAHRRGREGHCAYDHSLCHFCLVVGHVARDCAENNGLDAAVTHLKTVLDRLGRVSVVVMALEYTGGLFSELL